MLNYNPPSLFRLLGSLLNNVDIPKTRVGHILKLNIKLLAPELSVIVFLVLILQHF